MSDVLSSKGMLPCPLCASPVVFHHDPEECPGGCHNVQCLTCKSMFDLGTAADPENACETLEELQDRIVAVWNKRPTHEPSPAQVWICSNPQCRSAFSSDPQGHCLVCRQEDGSGWSTICTNVRTIARVQLCRPADRAMFATDAGQELLKAAQEHISTAQPPSPVRGTCGNCGEHPVCASDCPGWTPLSKDAQPPEADLLFAMRDWIEAAPHGDNCFLTDEYPGNQCVCGKESLAKAMDDAFGVDEPTLTKCEGQS